MAIIVLVVVLILVLGVGLFAEWAFGRNLQMLNYPEVLAESTCYPRTSSAVVVIAEAWFPLPPSPPWSEKPPPVEWR